ncbi:UNVERIFIED_ORG: uncharacterized protein YjbI with pentapeptide repeats [Nocardia globerula]|uniref:Uncharacterized protein YjbI with pentapeptide repeats n=1 Tax=Nocardia globerula TaxID=1818 RepID=A0A652YIQ8_NOCGL|nr:pentapeptide repeat-containing protein [Nocardia globerula]
MLYDSKPTWLQRAGPKIGIGAAAGAVGLLLGRAFSVPGSTEFWEVAGQPSATVLASAGVITAGYLAFQNGEKTRGLDAQHHRETMNGDRESNLQDRYTAAAKQLGDDDHSAIRQAGAYAIGALVDDWLRHGTVIPEPGSAHSQAKTCVHLLCSYLRANRREEAFSSFETEEAAVRSSIVDILRERTSEWREKEDARISQGKLTEAARIIVNLNGANLEKANFEGANLRGARLVKAELHSANLNDAKLHSAHLAGASFTEARLLRANLSGAHIKDADFSDAKAVDAIFTGARGQEFSFVRTKLGRAIFTDTNFSDADFSKAEAFGAVFAGSSILNTKFNGAVLVEADFSGCRLEGELFDEETTYSAKTKWPEGFLPQLGKFVGPPPSVPSEFFTVRRPVRSTIDNEPTN